MRIQTEKSIQLQQIFPPDADAGLPFIDRVRPDGTLRAGGLRPGRYRIEVRRDIPGQTAPARLDDTRKPAGRVAPGGQAPELVRVVDGAFQAEVPSALASAAARNGK